MDKGGRACKTADAGSVHRPSNSTATMKAVVVTIGSRSARSPEHSEGPILDI